MCTEISQHGRGAGRQREEAGRTKQGEHGSSGDTEYPAHVRPLSVTWTLSTSSLKGVLSRFFIPRCSSCINEVKMVLE